VSEFRLHFYTKNAGDDMRLCGSSWYRNDWWKELFATL